MKQFLTVLSFELTNYFKKKSFVITTLILAVIMIIGLSIPSFIDIPFLSSDKGTNIEDSNSVTDETSDSSPLEQFAILDKNNVIKDKDILKNVFHNSEWTMAKDSSELQSLVKEDKVTAAFEVKNSTEYEYFIKNSTIHDSNTMIFTEFLSKLYQQEAITEAGLNYEEINSIYNTPITSDISVLGKDNANNYFYAYALIFILYMMIIMYGQLIAMSVTGEKSNRAVEILVTSTNSNSLIFGKVIAGALAGIAQVTVLVGSGVLGYKFNAAAWNGLLDNIFKIPSNLLIVFALFGTFGYLLYALMFGALGALVSKTEDIGSSLTPVMLIFIAVFMISMFGLNAGDSMLIKVASFIPVSSPMTMLVRVAMGSVSTLEIIISFAILLITTILTGFIAAKIYRLGTLMYGNPIKLKNAIKLIRKNK